MNILIESGSAGKTISSPDQSNGATFSAQRHSMLMLSAIMLGLAMPSVVMLKVEASFKTPLYKTYLIFLGIAETRVGGNQPI